MLCTQPGKLETMNQPDSITDLTSDCPQNRDQLIHHTNGRRLFYVIAITVVLCVLSVPITGSIARAVYIHQTEKIDRLVVLGATALQLAMNTPFEDLGSSTTLLAQISQDIRALDVVDELNDYQGMSASTYEWAVTMLEDCMSNPYADVMFYLYIIDQGITIRIAEREKIDSRIAESIWTWGFRTIF